MCRYFERHIHLKYLKGRPYTDDLRQRGPPVNMTYFLRASVLVVFLTAFNGGCSTTGLTWNSLNPFHSEDPTGIPATTDPAPKVAAFQSVVQSDEQVEQTGGFTASAKNAWKTTANAVTGIFSWGDDEETPADESASDPLSLTNQPEKVNAEVYIANGQLWESTGDFTKAMESYSRALQSEPNHGPAIASIARLHFRNEKFAEAATFFRRAIDNQPEDAGLQNDLGLTLSKLGDSSLSIEHLTKALQLSPGNSRYSNNLATVLFNDQQEQAAMAVLDQNNQPAVAHFNMAYLYFQNGKLVQARDHLSEVMKYEVIATDDVATRRAVERTKEMLAGLDGQKLNRAVESIAARPVSGQFAPQAKENPSPVTQISDSNESGDGVPFSLPTGFNSDSTQQ